MNRNGLGTVDVLDVLLVDDNELDQMLFATAVKKADVSMRVRTATSAQGAIDYIQGKGKFSDRARHPMPDVLVLDLIMPVMSGMDLLVWRKRFPAFLKLPIVILSGANDNKLTKEALALGAKAYLAKPQAFEGWKDVIHTVRNAGLAHKEHGGALSLPERNKKGFAKKAPSLKSKR